MGKYSTVLGACGIHVCIGSVYAWSVLVHPIMDKMGWGLSSVTFAFSLAILFLGLSAGFLGNHVQRWGAKKSALISSALFTAGLFGSALSIHVGSLMLLYIFYGVIGGIGLGIGYISPVATLLKWFPDSRGFAGGCAVMSFGFAALIAGPLMTNLTMKYGLVDNFLIVATIYGTAMFFSSLLIKRPPRRKKQVDLSEKKEFDAGLSVVKAVRTFEFRCLWILFFVNIACGIALISIASPMAQELGASEAEAAALVGTLGIVNGAGRIISAVISDYVGRPVTYIMFFLIQTVAFSMLATMSDFSVFPWIVSTIVFCYGGGFSCMPAYLSDLFGLKHLSRIHGVMLTAWGIAGIVGPLFLSFACEHTGSYVQTMEFFVALFAASVIAGMKLKYSKRMMMQQAILDSKAYWEK